MEEELNELSLNPEEDGPGKKDDSALDELDDLWED